MAARKRRGVDTLPEEWRLKIQATQIINQLQACVLGQKDLTAQQVKSADILLKKIIPDLARQELTGKDGKELKLVDLVNNSIVSDATP